MCTACVSTRGTVGTMSVSDDEPRFRYNAGRAAQIEQKWQDHWEHEGTFRAPNPKGPLSDGFERMADRRRLYVLDMFPYPSGAGLHVGHPLGYIGTDVYARYKRMTGHNVLHAMGYDAFGLPAEQYAVQTGQHPRVTTEANIANMRRQMRRLGLGHDDRRSIATTDVPYYRWTQWIFLKIFNSWYDTEADRARPIDELISEWESGQRETGVGPWSDLTAIEQRRLVDSNRLAYREEAPVNWCPMLGTVLANEEVTADGRSERGNYPVYRRPLKQWMMGITAYADRLADDLDRLDWPEPIKAMQRNWIGKSHGAEVTFATASDPITVFTTRPDTLFGATYMVLAPEHPLVDAIAPADWPEGISAVWSAGAPTPVEAVKAYRLQAAQKSEIERQTDSKTKTGVFTGAYATNPVNGSQIPVFIADYVLMGYGTGAIMAVPSEDQRDWDFATAFDLPIVRTVQPPPDWDGEAYTGDGPAINSGFLDGMTGLEAKTTMIEWLQSNGVGDGTVTYKLRDWLFSRQRYWGEPFPIIYDDTGLPLAVPDDKLPVELPELIDWEPETSENDDTSSVPQPPLGRAAAWSTVSLDLGDGPKQYHRELNTMPQWAGSCWYFLRYLDPTNEQAFVDPDIERYWMGSAGGDRSETGGVDLYVGGVEHAVLHLLYARFWHKVLYDLGELASEEPFGRLFNQGYIQAAAFTDDRGFYVEASDVEETEEGFRYNGLPVNREFGKMGKSLKNAVTPDDIYAEYGADTLRLYEMFTGPLDQSRPWDSKDIVGVYRLLQRTWRLMVDEHDGELRVSDAAPSDETLRLVHKTIEAVRDGMEDMRFNVSIARLTELVNHLTQTYPDGGTPRPVAEQMVLMFAPLASHVAEELWEMLGHTESIVWEPFPVADPSLLIEEEIEIVIQIKGKVRAKLTVPAQADDAALLAAVKADAKVANLLEGVEIKKEIVVPGRLVNFVTA